MTKRITIIEVKDYVGQEVTIDGERGKVFAGIANAR